MHLRILAPILIAGMLHAQSAPAPVSTRESAWSVAALKTDIARLAPFARPLPVASGGDWLASQKEAGQTFVEWLAENPVTVTEERRFIYVQPVGGFTPEERDIREKTAEHLGLFFGLRVKTLPPISTHDWPAEAHRTQLSVGRQLHAGYIVFDLLKPRLPKDAAFVIAFTAEDLWPGDGWNYVFGLASTQDRAGVWSIRRFGATNGSAADRRMVLRRAIKVATHESGHMFTIAHCTANRCGMNGANNLPEADGQPVEFCPQCLAKLCRATESDPRRRFAALQEWYAKNGFTAEEKDCALRIAALNGTAPAAPVEPPAAVTATFTPTQVRRPERAPSKPAR